MKIERKETEFTPIVITLETQNEVDKLLGLLNLVDVSCDEFLETLYDNIENYYQDSIGHTSLYRDNLLDNYGKPR